jgi:hypothetical protein
LRPPEPRKFSLVTPASCRLSASQASSRTATSSLPAGFAVRRYVLNDFLLVHKFYSLEPEIVQTSAGYDTAPQVTNISTTNRLAGGYSQVADIWCVVEQKQLTKTTTMWAKGK